MEQQKRAADAATPQKSLHSDSITLSEAKQYLSLGWVLTPMPIGTKAPLGKGWNTPEVWIDTVTKAEQAFSRPANLGLIHGPSATCVLDVDDLETTKKVFSEFGFDYDALLAGAPRIKGSKTNRDKAIFRYPKGHELSHHKLTWGATTIFELRTGLEQDVLPPSIHPEGHAYTWGKDPFAGIPDLPPDLLRLWIHFKAIEPQLKALDPLAKPVRKPNPTERTGQNSGSIEKYNARFTVQEMLESNGYKPMGNRFLAPSSKSGMPGVTIFSDGKCYSQHASDILNDGHSHDAFDVFRILKHAGDFKAAAKAAAEILGISFTDQEKREYAEKQTPEPENKRETNHPEINSTADMNKSGVTSVTGVTACGSATSGVTPQKLEGVTGVTNPEKKIPSLEERPCFLVFDDWLETEGRKLKPGVYFFGMKPGTEKKPPTPTETWLCGPLHVQAVVSDSQQNNFGRLLRFRNTLKAWRKWSMPMDLLRGSGEELRGELLSMGLEFAFGQNGLFQNYLLSKTPQITMKCAIQTGWTGDSFVLPDKVFGPRAADIIFQSGERGHDEYPVGGTLDGWRVGVAAMAAGNPLLVLAISAAFAGPLLEKCGSEGGGVHFVGDSSTGKSTIIESACSVWGGTNFKRSWRGTANGQEAVATLFNDCLLALDEISESDPREIGQILYSLGNGRGKQRANKTGSAKGVSRWRCMILSSGEKTIETHMREGGREPKAGQGIRLLNVPATRAYGAWDTLQSFPSGAAFSDALRAEALKNFGHPGRAFLEKLTADSKNLPELFREIKALPAFTTDGNEGQEKRAAARFALIALAGELATEYGLTGWAEGDSAEAAGKCFQNWLTGRGRGNEEKRQILTALSDFINRHGDSRFSPANGAANLLIRDRAGWVIGEGDDRRYLFHTDGLREAFHGHDVKRALDTLEDVGAIVRGLDGKRATLHRIGGVPKRLYSIDPTKLEAGHGD